MLKQDAVATGFGSELVERVTDYGISFPKHAVIGVILMIALFAFEMFNFDTTRYALTNLLGPVSFAGLGWATILAVAFCAIDFAGLVRLFTPEGEAGEQPKEVWYLMGAWLLGATMNALMTWWAVSLTLLNHEFGNEVLSRAQLLQVVPIFVAVLVWLTRILFIGALTMAGEHLMAFRRNGRAATSSAMAVKSQTVRQAQPMLSRRPAAAAAGDAAQVVTAQASRQKSPRPRPEVTPVTQQETNVSRDLPSGLRKVDEEGRTPSKKKRPAPKPNGRVRQRPPIPGARRKGISARPRRGN